MLDLRLREEFLSSQMPRTAVELRRADNADAAQQNSDRIMSIT